MGSRCSCGLQAWVAGVNLGAGCLHVAQTIAMIVLLQTRFAGQGWWILYVDGVEHPFRMAWLLPFFTGISGVAALVVWWRTRREMQLKKRGRLVNTVLWIEYSVSSAACLWVVCIQCGIDALWKLLLESAANVLLMYTGYRSELAMYRANKAVLRTDPGSVNLQYTVPREALAWFWFGMALFTAMFVPIWYYFFERATRPGVPDAVLVIIPVITLLYISFGFAAAYYLNAFRLCAFKEPLASRFDKTRLTYAILSFSVKSFLAWFVLFGALRDPRAA